MPAGSTLNESASQTAPPPDSVRAELRKIRESAFFQAAPRLQQLLSYLVDETLAGSALKEAVVGVAVFSRDPGYDPKRDSVVRSEVRRLRVKLLEYYATEGLRDEVIIDLPKGSYVLAFRFGQAVEPTVAAAPKSPARRLKLPAAIAAGTTLVLAAAILAAYGLRLPEGSDGSKHSPRRSVAVLDFRNLTARPEAGWLASAIPEMLSADLADGQQLRTIPGENVSRMEVELSLHPIGASSRQTLTAIRRNVDADIVISGAYADLGAEGGRKVRVDIWAEDAQSGDVIASISESATESEILDLLSRAGARLRSGLQLRSSGGEASMRAALPETPAAARMYADGLAHLHRGELLQARDLLGRSAQLEADFGPAHAALSSAYAKLGYEGQAREEAKRAYELSPRMLSLQRVHGGIGVDGDHL